MELVAHGSDDKESKGSVYPAAQIIADESDESLWLEVFFKQGSDKFASVQFSLSELKTAFEAAEGEVHSEKWHEDNGFQSESDN